MNRAMKLTSLFLISLALVSACQKKDETTTTGPEWTWVSGSETVDQKGTYGTPGAGDPSNVPGAREEAVSWRDGSGRLWLFGGYGFDSEGFKGRLNDLWRYDTSAAVWTWVSGGNIKDQPGIYGTIGLSALANVPGARSGAVSWTDAQGNLWLFGGLGFAAGGDYGNLNDLWKYDPAGLGWAWVSGGQVADAGGVYGTKGAASPSNVPGARTRPVSWLDADGRLWLFGGYGQDSAGAKGWLNDLWVFDPTLSQWTWISGSNVGGQAGVYGTKGTADPANAPGGRYAGVSWIDEAGAVWLFGGEGLDKDGTRGALNDFWTYAPDTGEWTWISGSSAIASPGEYGTKGTGATSTVPGARTGAVSWIDADGVLWLFGGYGYYAAGYRSWLSDLWRYSPSSELWAWIAGSSSGGGGGTYGTKGTADAANFAGSRYSAVSWFDSLGRMWLFGGYGSDSKSDGGWLNDLWRMTQ